jgi:hypothetical protein
MAERHHVRMSEAGERKRAKARSARRRAIANARRSTAAQQLHLMEGAMSEAGETLRSRAALAVLTRYNPSAPWITFRAFAHISQTARN